VASFLPHDSAYTNTALAAAGPATRTGTMPVARTTTTKLAEGAGGAGSHRPAASRSGRTGWGPGAWGGRGRRAGAVFAAAAGAAAGCRVFGLWGVRRVKVGDGLGRRAGWKGLALVWGCCVPAVARVPGMRRAGAVGPQAFVVAAAVAVAAPLGAGGPRAACLVRTERRWKRATGAGPG
jgi:hypothetical protein